MRIDIQSLETYNRLAREGAEEAAESLGTLTGVETFVEVTKVNLLSATDLRAALTDEEFAGVRIRFDGGLAGQTVLAFDRDSVETLTEEVLPRLLGGADGDLGESGIKEVGNIVTSGFIDGWAEYLGTPIDISTPEFVGYEAVEDLLDDVPIEADEYAFVFESQLGAVDEAVEFQLFMLPERTAVADVLAADGGGDALPLDKLVAFDRMTAKGAEGASDHMTTMTGLDTEVDVTKLSFVPVHEAPQQVGDDQRHGTVFELQGLEGYLVILFDEESARSIADAMVPMDTGDGFGDMDRSALEEVCNVMTSGFIDGWANVLGTTIDHSPPEFVSAMGSAVLDPVAARLGRTQEYAFVVDTLIRTEASAVDCDIYVLPEADALTRELAALDTDRMHKLDQEASFARIENGEL
ncbi:MAG: chemotaxis protein CheC [Haloferacaceae archaeon]